MCRNAERALVAPSRLPFGGNRLTIDPQMSPDLLLVYVAVATGLSVALRS